MLNLSPDKSDKLTEDYADLIKQINTEFDYASDYMAPWFIKMKERHQIYNRQDKDPQAVSEPLLFSIHQTTIAALYDDKLLTKWTRRHGDDDELMTNLNFLAEADYKLMDKDQIDYDWIWNTGFYGRAILGMMGWDKDKLCPMPEVWNMMQTMRDPDAWSVNGDNWGRGASRFIGRQYRMTVRDLMENPVYKGIDTDKVEEAAPREGTFDLNEYERVKSTGHNPVAEIDKLVGPNRSFPVVEWYTFYEIDGKIKRVLVQLTNGMTRMIRFQVLPEKKWPLIDRTLPPKPGEWDGVSIADLVEDKQRAIARIMNHAMNAIEANQDPRYLYDKRVISRKHLLNSRFNKYIPTNGPINNAMMPVPKDLINQEVSYLLGELRSRAETSTATPQVQQGNVGSTNKTATELSLVETKVDTRYSLSAKIFGWSENKFWEDWYYLYDKHFSDKIVEKSIEIGGNSGKQIKVLRRYDIISGNETPMVTTESSIISETKRRNSLQLLTNLRQNVAQSPGINLRFLDRKMAKDSGLTPDEVNRLIPPTPHEIAAMEENDLFIDGKSMDFATVGEDHIVHRRIHSKLDMNEPKVKAHLLSHSAMEKIERAKKGDPNFNQPETPGPEDQQRAALNNPQESKPQFNQPGMPAPAAPAPLTNQQ